MALDNPHRDPRRDRLDTRNRQAWDQLYQETPDLVWGRTPVGFLGPFLDRLAPGLESHSQILDAACGEGRNLPLLAQLPGVLHGCDASEHALQKAAAWLEIPVDLHLCPLEALPFAAETFDGILACDILETLPQLDKPLEELHRVLRPGGRLLCNIPDLDDHEVVGVEMTDLGPREFLYRERFFYRFMDTEEAQRQLTQAGFSILHSERCQWTEPAHPGFRERPHEHTSQVFLLGRAALG